MRIIAGQYRRRRLHALQGIPIRPTSDRLRETLFNVLCAGNPRALAGTYWLDLYAGTGAVGIEALSRGAERVDFVESSHKAARLIAKNLHSLGIEHGFRVIEREVRVELATLSQDQAQADFIFLDPPYGLEDAYGQTYESLIGSPRLKSSTVVIAEHQRKFDPGESFPRIAGRGQTRPSTQLRRYRHLVQGDAALSFYQVA